ncbi:CHAD domain-containing protein [Bacillus sp. EB600]|uniref:CHAD domain-containing protein n=1 Tax=Bacillus sp. EB600 TaxID=2806345 RepID=UPI0021091E65|nr:CHAD domain-containing protein [Bacillus sp. EB600]MCQ6278786.1 CHAD domain-containing protein [Bacillus sp. EB600]
MEMENNEQQCSICSSSESLLQVHEKWICRECLHIGIEKLTSTWKEPLVTLFKEYSEKCNGCTSTDHPEVILQARVIGLKIRAVLEFLGLEKNHELLLAVRKMNRVLTSVRQSYVFLDEAKNKSNENKAYAALVKAGTKKQQKLQQQMFEKIPAIFNDSFVNKVEKFITNELVFYILPPVKENVLSQDEGCFNQLADNFYRSVEEKGQTNADTIKTLDAVQKKSASLFYIYNYLNEIFNEKFQQKETYYKQLQQKFSDINDTETSLSQIKRYEKKLNAPKSDIDNIKKAFKERLADLIHNDASLKVSVKEM